MNHTVHQIFFDKLPNCVLKVTKSYLKWTCDYGRTWESCVTPCSACVGYKSSVTVRAEEAALRALEQRAASSPLTPLFNFLKASDRSWSLSVVPGGCLKSL